MSTDTLREGLQRSKGYHGTKEPGCPVCPGLECLCRPRYFSGQLLTEGELNAEQQYLVKKNRLHNLYLHGFGVVCGLEVLCHPSCKGWVTVKQGYAISPCGDDVILCKDVDFPLVDRIDECLRKKQKREDCAPYAATSADCDADGCWYLTVEYDEQATRAMTALRPETQASMPVCTCGCDTNGGCSCGCGCGCGGGTTTAAHGCNGNGHNGAATKPATRTPLNVPCEPTRICEGYKLDICRAPTEGDLDCEELLAGTLLGRIYECLLEAVELIGHAPKESANLSDLQRYSACCAYLREVRTFFETHPTTRCELLDKLGTISCPKADDVTGSYAAAVDKAVDELSKLVLRHVLDCICLDLLPPCPPDPGDDRLILAEVCVQDGKIVEICNLKGRRHVWTWPTVRYWASLLPFELVISQLVERLCCGEWSDLLADAQLDDRVIVRGLREQAGPCNPLALLVGLLMLVRGYASVPQTQAEVHYTMEAHEIVAPQ